MLLQCRPCDSVCDGEIRAQLSVSGFFNSRNSVKVCSVVPGSLSFLCSLELFFYHDRQAFYYVQQRRFCINPNEGFAQQLSEYEPIYKARLTYERGQPSQENGSCLTVCFEGMF